MEEKEMCILCFLESVCFYEELRLRSTSNCSSVLQGRNVCRVFIQFPWQHEKLLPKKVKKHDGTEQGHKCVKVKVKGHRNLTWHGGLQR